MIEASEEAGDRSRHLADLPAQDNVEEGDLRVQTTGALAADVSEQPIAVVGDN